MQIALHATWWFHPVCVFWRFSRRNKYTVLWLSLSLPLRVVLKVHNVQSQTVCNTHCVVDIQWRRQPCLCWLRDVWASPLYYWMYFVLTSRDTSINVLIRFGCMSMFSVDTGCSCKCLLTLDCCSGLCRSLCMQPDDSILFVYSDISANAISIRFCDCRYRCELYWRSTMFNSRQLASCDADNNAFADCGMYKHVLCATGCSWDCSMTLVFLIDILLHRHQCIDKFWLHEHVLCWYWM